MRKENDENMPDIEKLIQSAGVSESEAKLLRESLRFKRMTKEQQYAYLEPEQHIAERIRAEARIGRLIDPDRLRAIDFSFNPKSSEDRAYPAKEYKKVAQQTRRHYLHNIEEYGDDAIAHLGIPENVLYRLLQTGGYYRHIPTITALEDHIREYGERREEAIFHPFARHLTAPVDRLYIHLLFTQYETWKQIPPSVIPPTA